MAMLYLGRDPNSLDPEGPRATSRALLKGVRPYIRYFSSAKMLIDLPNEEVCIAMSWSGDYAQAMMRAQAGRQAGAARVHDAEGGDARLVRPLVHPRRRAASRQRPPVPQLPAPPRGRRADQHRDALCGAEPAGDRRCCCPRSATIPAVYPPESVRRSRCTRAYIHDPKEERAPLAALVAREDGL